MAEPDNAAYAASLADPAGYFGSPQAVVDAAYLSHDQKHFILSQWEQDASLLEHAEREAMQGRDLSHLRDVLLAKDELERRLRHDGDSALDGA
jgi:hypothetical protein